MEEPFLIVGLGNPGREYAETRHNIGFMASDRLAALWGAGWNLETKFQSRLAKAAVEGKRLLLSQPQTYMNASGEAVAAIANFHRVPPARVLVLVDDADLPLGEVRMRPGGSAGGHHGIESVIRHLGTNDFPRLRMGIGRGARGAREITGFVLAPFSPAEKTVVDLVVDRAARQVEIWVRDGIQQAMNRFNGAVESPGEAKDTE